MSHSLIDSLVHSLIRQWPWFIDSFIYSLVADFICSYVISLVTPTVHSCTSQHFIDIPMGRWFLLAPAFSGQLFQASSLLNPGNILQTIFDPNRTRHITGWCGTFFFYFSIDWECHHPKWWSPSFFRGVGEKPPSSNSVYPGNKPRIPIELPVFWDTAKNVAGAWAVESNWTSRLRLWCLWEQDNPPFLLGKMSSELLKMVIYDG